MADTVLSLLREFVEWGPPIAGDMNDCTYCAALWPARDADHESDCLWLRAKRLLERRDCLTATTMRDDALTQEFDISDPPVVTVVVKEPPDVP